jgi:hypothetical protein
MRRQPSTGNHFRAARSGPAIGLTIEDRRAAVKDILLDLAGECAALGKSRIGLDQELKEELLDLGIEAAKLHLKV